MTVATERTAGPRSARNFLARALMQVRPTWVTFEAKWVTVFAGDAENLEFVAPLSEHVGTPGLYILRLTLDKDGRLVLTRWLLHPDALGGKNDGWSKESHMPLAIRIHLTTEGHTWPDMFFRLPQFELTTLAGS